MQQFSVKSLDYVKELQHPRGMKHCTQKTSDVLLNKALKCFQLCSCRRDTMSRSLKLTSQKYNSHSFHPSARQQTVCRCDPPSPSVGQVQNLLLSSPPSPSPSSPVYSGSGDNLWLPGLAGHLGATLCDDWRACRGLTVQAEATHHVLQSCAFWLPLLSGLF